MTILQYGCQKFTQLKFYKIINKIVKMNEMLSFPYKKRNLAA